MKISSRAKRLIGQGMFQIKAQAEELERQGKKLIHFEIGDSYFDAPKKVKKACIKAIKQNKTHYIDPKGLYELRKAIAEDYKVEIGNVAIVPANFGIFATLSILCNKGDKINYPLPSFPTYKAVVDYLGLKSSKKAKVAIACYPNNPDGKFHWNTGAYIIHDIPYISMTYKFRHKGMEKLFEFGESDLKRNLFIFSFSKSHSMSGFRLGYIIALKEIIDKVGLLIETTYSCLPEFIQWAGLEALKIEQYRMKELKKRRDLMYKILREQYELEKPEGGIYCWCRLCKSTTTGKEEFERLLKKGVVVCPGEVFGEKGYVRFCFAKPIKEIKELRRLIK